MADNNYNMIKPVEGLQNIAGLTPVKQREKRNRQKNPKQQDRHEQNLESTPEENIEMESEDVTKAVPGDSNSIDYCA